MPKNRDHLKSVPPPSETRAVAPAAAVPLVVGIDPPPELKDLELSIWWELLGEYQGRLSAEDRTLFGRLVRKEFDYRTARTEVDRLGMLIKSPSGYPIQNPYLAIMNKAASEALRISIQLGLTPLARGRVKNSGRKKPSAGPWDQLRTLTD